MRMISIPKTLIGLKILATALILAAFPFLLLGGMACPRLGSPQWAYGLCLLVALSCIALIVLSISALGRMWTGEWIWPWSKEPEKKNNEGYEIGGNVTGRRGEN